MKSKFIRVLILPISMLCMMVLLSCGSNKSNVETRELELKIGELYKIPDIADDAVVFNGLFKSEDTSIAEVRGGKYIKAFSEGETTIYGTINDVEIEYVVSVVEEEDRLRRKGVKPIQDKSVYLGGGYNMFNAKGMQIYKEINLSAIFLPDTITEYINKMQVEADILDADGNATGAKEKYTKAITSDDLDTFYINSFTGKSLKEYANNYQTEINGSLGVKVSSLAIEGEVQGKYENGNVDKGKTQSAMGTIFAIVGKSTYSLTLDKATLRELAQQNTYAWKELTGTMSPSEVFC